LTGTSVPNCNVLGQWEDRSSVSGGTTLSLRAAIAATGKVLAPISLQYARALRADRAGRESAPLVKEEVAVNN